MSDTTIFYHSSSDLQRGMKFIASDNHHDSLCVEVSPHVEDPDFYLDYENVAVLHFRLQAWLLERACERENR